MCVLAIQPNGEIQTVMGNARIDQIRIQNHFWPWDNKKKYMDPNCTLKRIFDEVYEIRFEQLSDVIPIVQAVNPKTGALIKKFDEPVAILDEHGLPTGDYMDSSGLLLQHGMEWMFAREMVKDALRSNSPTFGTEGNMFWYGGKEDWGDDVMQTCMQIALADEPDEYPPTDPRSKYYQYWDFNPLQQKMALCVRATGVTVSQTCDALDPETDENGVIIKEKKNKVVLEDLDFSGTDVTVEKILDPTVRVDADVVAPLSLPEILVPNG